MVITEPQNNFQAGVELDFAVKPSSGGSLKHGEKVNLVARFRDFLGEPTRDTGKISLSVSSGEIYLPNGGVSGSVIELGPGEAGISDTGELALVYIPDNTIGKVDLQITCSLGESKLALEMAAPAGYAMSEMLESVIYAFLVAIVIRIFFFQTFWIPSGSMEPTLFEQDRIVANKLLYRLREPDRGEVVIFRVFQPGLIENGTFRSSGTGKLTLVEAQENIAGRQANPFMKENDEPSEVYVVRPQDYIKRVVGLPGETIEIIDRVIYIDGAPVEELFDTRMPNYEHYGPVNIPPGEIFVLGDNRSNSQDSHVIGTIPLRNVEGRAEVVFWPPRRIGLIPQGNG